MRKFRLRTLEEMRHRERWESMTPAPFPTRPTRDGGEVHAWPTRIAILGRHANGKVLFSYIGKPTKFAAQRVGELCERMIAEYAKRVSFLDVYEFDRKNIIRYGHLVNPWGNGVARMLWQHCNNALWRYYHPWDLRGAEVGTTFLDELYLKRILDRKGRVHSVYSPLEQLKVKTHIDPFRVMVEGMGI